MTVTEFLQAVQLNVNRVKQYQLGMDGTDGLCDCVGLIIGAVRLAGQAWHGTHGSNYAWRNRVKDKHLTAECVQLGELVFKAYEKGDSGWNLPVTYANDPDQKDMYHVGVVTSVSPLMITHCTSVPGGIKRDTVLGKWKWAGTLDIVDIEEAKPMATNARVLIPEGRAGTTVNVRKRPDMASPVVTTVKHGTEVTVGEMEDGWYPISVDGNTNTGYMMAEFIRVEEAAAPAGDILAEAKAKIAEAQKKLDEALAALKGAGE